MASMVGLPDNERMYEPLADLFVYYNDADQPVSVHRLRQISCGDMPLPVPGGVTQYLRTLDLLTGVHQSSYTLHGLPHSITSFASHVDSVIGLRTQGRSFTLHMRRGNYTGRLYSSDNRTILLSGENRQRWHRLCVRRPCHSRHDTLHRRNAAVRRRQRYYLCRRYGLSLRRSRTPSASHARFSRVQAV